MGFNVGPDRVRDRVRGRRLNVAHDVAQQSAGAHQRRLTAAEHGVGLWQFLAASPANGWAGGSSGGQRSGSVTELTARREPSPQSPKPDRPRSLCRRKSETPGGRRPCPSWDVDQPVSGRRDPGGGMGRPHGSGTAEGAARARAGAAPIAHAFQGLPRHAPAGRRALNLSAATTTGKKIQNDSANSI